MSRAGSVRAVERGRKSGDTQYQADSGYLGTTFSFAWSTFANIQSVREGSPITRRRLHTSVRKTLLSYYSVEEAAEIVKAAKRLRISISKFIASAALKEAEVTNSSRRKPH
jgi:hypothetical protein